MENNEKVISIVAVTLLALVGISTIFGVASRLQSSFAQSQGGAFGTALTMNSSNGSYVDGQDKLQNLQAIAERFTGLRPYQFLQADSTGNLQAVNSTSTAGPWTFGPLTQGGGVTATSTSGTVVPLLVTDFDTENVIDVTLNVQDATLSFPASSTFTSLLPTSANSRTIMIRNATTTEAIDLTISGGTGVYFKNTTSTGIIYGDTDGMSHALVTMTRLANTDILLSTEIFRD